MTIIIIAMKNHRYRSLNFTTGVFGLDYIAALAMDVMLMKSASGFLYPPFYSLCTSTNGRILHYTTLIRNMIITLATQISKPWFGIGVLLLQAKFRK